MRRVGLYADPEVRADDDVPVARESLVNERIAEKQAVRLGGPLPRDAQCERSILSGKWPLDDCQRAGGIGNWTEQNRTRAAHTRQLNTIYKILGESGEEKRSKPEGGMSTSFC